MHVLIPEAQIRYYKYKQTDKYEYTHSERHGPEDSKECSNISSFFNNHSKAEWLNRLLMMLLNYSNTFVMHKI